MKNILLAVVLVFPLSAAAQTPVSPGRYLEEIQRRQQQEQQEILRRREVDAAKKAQEASAAAAREPAETGPEAEGCIPVQKLSVSGVGKINRGKVYQAVSERIKPCLSKRDLRELQALVQQMYIKKGYIGARVYFDFSAIKAQTLRLVADEGVLEKIVMENGEETVLTGARIKRQIWDAFPNQTGKPLNLRDIEQGLDQMNKLESNDVTMEVRPGEQDGGSIVVLKNRKSDSTQINAGYDNSGQNSTGRYKGSLSASQDNLLSLNDNLFINAASTLWNNRGVRYADSLTASWRIPLGAWTFADSFSYSRYLTTSQGAVGVFESSGNSSNNTFSAERMMLRGASYKLTLGAQLTVKDGNNYLEDVYLDTASRTLTVGSVYLTGTYYSRFGSVFSRLGYNAGLPVFGSAKDTDTTAGKPRAEFKSVSWYLNYSNNFGPVNYTANVDAQYTRDDLFSSEQMLLGGEGTVRGFRDESLSGDSGFYMRNDIRISAGSLLGRSLNPRLTAFFQQTYLGLFADYGYVKPRSFGESGSLAGAGIKISYYGKRLSGNFAWARSLLSPDGFKNEGNIFYFNVAWSLGF